MSTPDAAVPGRTVVSARAYEQLLRAIAGEALAVGARAASATVSDRGGRLRIDIRGPISGEGMPVLDRIARAREAVSEKTRALTGATVDDVHVHVTDIRFSPRRAA